MTLGNIAFWGVVVCLVWPLFGAMVLAFVDTDHKIRVWLRSAPSLWMRDAMLMFWPVLLVMFWSHHSGFRWKRNRIVR